MPDRGIRRAREREGTVSNEIGLILAIALVAALFALVFVIRKSPGKIAGQNGTAQVSGLQPGVTTQQLEEARALADEVRERAEADAASIMRKAEAAAEQVTQGRREVEDEIRAVKDEV